MLICHHSHSTTRKLVSFGNFLSQESTAEIPLPCDKTVWRITSICSSFSFFPMNKGSTLIISNDGWYFYSGSIHLLIVWWKICRGWWVDPKIFVSEKCLSRILFNLSHLSDKYKITFHFIIGFHWNGNIYLHRGIQCKLM